jgi:hypothetical protein
MPLIRSLTPADNRRMSVHPQPQIFKRIALTLGLGVAFIVMASVFSPDRTRASDDTAAPRELRNRINRRADDSVNAHQGLRSLGEIESGKYAISIYATDQGPRYTITEIDSGDEIGTLLTPAQIEQLLPELDLKSLDFSATSDNAQTMSIAEPQG